MTLSYCYSKSSSLSKDFINRKLSFCVLFLLLILSSTKSFSQSNNWSVKLEPQKSFIENKGQFQGTKENQEILFAFDGGTTRIYFTKNGISYQFIKREPKEKEMDEFEERITSFEEWKEKEAEERKTSYETDVVSMIWENANTDVEIVAEDATIDYHSYTFNQKDGSVKNINNIKGFKKITYKNLYPGIDVEYVFHSESGIKYSIVLHSGADVSKIKMKYSSMPQISDNGDVHIPTKFGDIVDHAPLTFYAENKSANITSSFMKNGNSISFSLNEYNVTKSVVIDPWTDLPILPNSNGVWECERDGSGNVYMIGGEMPMQLYKYDALGALQWTYYTPWDTANDWLGTFITDDAGNSFVTNGSIAALERINTTGGLDWQANSGFGSVNEYWNIAFNCDQTKMIIGGTTGSMLSLSGAIFDINTSNGSVNSTRIVGSGNMFGFPPIIEECRSITSCRNARYYYLTLDSIGSIDDDFSACPGSIFKIDDGYHFSYKCENYKPNNGNSGVMCIRANRYFVYTQNGSAVQKRSLIDGSIITSAPIPGGSTINDPFFGRNQAGNAGIDIDSCGNVYVGSSDGIYKFDADLNLITSIATPFKVFDVAVSLNGNVIFCGSTGDCNTNGNRNGEIQSANMSACPPMILFCCNANICPVNPLCNNDAPITLNGGGTGGVWSGPGVDPTTGVFDPSVAGA